MGCDEIVFYNNVNMNKISIHAPIVGCDGERYQETAGQHISIHAPIVGCDKTANIIDVTM